MTQHRCSSHHGMEVWGVSPWTPGMCLHGGCAMKRMYSTAVWLGVCWPACLVTPLWNAHHVTVRPRQVAFRWQLPRPVGAGGKV
jgi:hypothetical protein